MNDDDLKRAFEKLRADDARRVPTFDAVRQRRRSRVSPWAVAMPILTTLAAAALFVVRCGSSGDLASSASRVAAAPAPVATPSPCVDDAPLDFLLEIPGLRGTPNFDTSFLRGSIR